MKNFTSPSFFRLFDLLMSTHNPGFRRSRWTLDGVACARERHSFNAQWLSDALFLPRATI
jgi:hypothetical protein